MTDRKQFGETLQTLIDNGELSEHYINNNYLEGERGITAQDILKLEQQFRENMKNRTVPVPRQEYRQFKAYKEHKKREKKRKERDDMFLSLIIPYSGGTMFLTAWLLDMFTNISPHRGTQISLIVGLIVTGAIFLHVTGKLPTNRKAG